MIVLIQPLGCHTLINDSILFHSIPYYSIYRPLYYGDEYSGHGHINIFSKEFLTKYGVKDGRLGRKTRRCGKGGKRKSMRTYGRVKDGRGGKDKKWRNREGGNAKKLRSVVIPSFSS